MISLALFQVTYGKHIYHNKQFINILHIVYIHFTLHSQKLYEENVTQVTIERVDRQYYICAKFLFLFILCHLIHICFEKMLYGFNCEYIQGFSRNF